MCLRGGMSGAIGIFGGGSGQVGRSSEHWLITQAAFKDALATDATPCISFARISRCMVVFKFIALGIQRSGHPLLNFNGQIRQRSINLS